MPKISLNIRSANWETVAFLLIYDFLKTTGKCFNRSELMRTENLDKAVNWLQHLNPKKNPKNPEETLQRTIQNLRDKGYIIFHGQGKYELTNLGVEECERVARELNVQVADVDETIQLIKEEYNAKSSEIARKIIAKLSPEEINSLLERIKASK